MYVGTSIILHIEGNSVPFSFEYTSYSTDVSVFDSSPIYYSG